MKTPITICYWSRKQRIGTCLEQNSPVTIYCRLTVRGQKGRAEFSTCLDTVYGNWVPANGMGFVKGKTQADKHINIQLTKLRDELNDIHADLERQGKTVTAAKILRLYRNNGASLSLVELFEAWMLERKGLVGLEISSKSHSSYKMRLNRLNDFLKSQRLTDLRPEDFTHNIADKFLYWLLQERSFKRSTANKTIQVVFQMLRWGVRRELLDKNPLELYQYKTVAAGEMKYLTVREVAHLSMADVPAAYLDRVRDCFIFQCWTGLAYADLAALDVRGQADYFRDNTGNLRRVLRVTRAKSTIQKGYECVIPLLPEAERLLAKYGDELPVPTNQVYNKYLKELGLLYGLPADKMTTHVGRKTAGVMMLNAGIRMEVVSKFLGHSSVRMTEKVYAKILDRTVVDAFSEVFGSQYATAAPAPARSILPHPEPAPTVASLRPARRIAQPNDEVTPESPDQDNRWRRPPPTTRQRDANPQSGRIVPMWAEPTTDRKEVGACG